MKYTIHVKRDVLFEAQVSAKTIEEALEKAKALTVEQLWLTPGGIIDDEHKITAVFE
jgi:hypothetical protein